MQWRPGTIATELAAKAVLTSEDAKKRIMSRTPMKRLGEPWEIADTVAYLASDAASYITGEIVVVGWRAHDAQLHRAGVVDVGSEQATAPHQ